MLQDDEYEVTIDAGMFIQTVCVCVCNLNSDGRILL